jgi:hypothetical protein
MRYEKPTVVELGARARFASGNWPLGCYDGSAAGGDGETCWVGVGAEFDLQPCWTGSSPTDGGLASDCIGGSSAYYCESGASPQHSDPFGCRNGPSVIL